MSAPFAYKSIDESWVIDYGNGTYQDGLAANPLTCATMSCRNAEMSETNQTKINTQIETFQQTLEHALKLARADYERAVQHVMLLERYINQAKNNDGQVAVSRFVPKVEDVHELKDHGAMRERTNERRRLRYAQARARRKEAKAS